MLVAMKRWQNWLPSWLFVCVLGIGLVLAPFAEADAALNAYLKLKGQKQGTIKGGVTKAGREGAIEIIAVSHEITSPRDAASGLPTGKRMHKPFVITKQIDKSSPLLASALVNNENIPTWELSVYQPSAKGQEAMAYTIKLTDASIAAIRLLVDDKGNMTEEVTFTYKKIEWTWVDGGITSEDDWQQPVASK
jgi:type VI secretion system secreted protein Hcp